MAFQDYELIHTKRVNRIRHGTDIYRQRYFAAQGGWNSLFFLAAFGGAGHQLRQVCGKNKNLINFPCVGQNKSFALWVVVPAISGYLLGIHTFGDAKEFRRLGTFNRQYN